MIAKDLAEQVRAEVRRLKEVQDDFLQTYKRLCVDLGGTEWQKARFEIVFHHVREEIIPIMEQAGMDHNGVQALCSWAEKLVTKP
jgi:hypothetical protein